MKFGRRLHRLQDDACKSIANRTGADVVIVIVGGSDSDVPNVEAWGLSQVLWTRSDLDKQARAAMGMQLLGDMMLSQIAPGAEVTLPLKQGIVRLTRPKP